MESLRGAEALLARAERALLAALLAFMVLTAFCQVLLRLLSSGGLLWADTLLRHLVLWVGFLGAGLAAASDRQFAMDLSARLLRNRARAVSQSLCHLFSMSVSALLARASWLFFREEYAQAQVLFTAGGVGLPAWAFEAVLPLGFGLLALHYLIKAALAGTPAR